MGQNRKLEKIQLFRGKKNAAPDDFSEPARFRSSLLTESQAFMLPSLKIGRFFGIPVYLHSTLLLLPALVFFTSSGQGWPAMLFVFAATLTLFTCVLLHEFGHALMARRFGIVTRDVTLYPIGGVARLERMTEKPIEEILIALAGPAVNVLIAALLTPIVLALAFLGTGISADPTAFSAADPPAVWLTRFCFFVWGGNIILVLFNLIPAFPMDGGRVFRAILAHFFGLLRGTEIAVLVGIVIAFVGAFAWIGGPILGSLIATGHVGTVNNPMLLVIAGFVAFIGPMELRALRYRERQKRDALRSQQYVAAEPLPYTPLPYPDEDDVDPLPAAPLPSIPSQPQSDFSGYTWDGEFGVWVKWQNGRRVAAFWNGSE
jgi:Zn-dependent protease